MNLRDPNFSSTYEEQDFGGNGNHKHKRNGNGGALLENAEDIISLMKGTQMNNKIFSDKVRFVTGATSRIDKATAVESALKPRYTKTKRIINLVAVITTGQLAP